MSATFPPGPYEVSWRKTKSRSWELRAADGRILTSSSTIIPEDEIEALGRLLKAAPDLFPALDQLLAEVVNDPQAIACVDLRIIERAKAALAKVQGP